MSIKNYTYEFRIYPTKEQEIVFAKHFGSSRFIYNYFLHQRKEHYLNTNETEKRTLNYYDNARELTKLKKGKEYEWLREINSQSLQFSLKCLEVSFQRFYRKVSKFPKFRSKSHKQSFHIPQGFSIENNNLWIPKLKIPIKINLHREIEGKICGITIKKNPSGKYFACILVERNIKELKKNNKQIGIDLGLKDFIIDSNGNKIDNPKYYRKQEKELKYNQKQLSKKVKGSNNRNKQRIIVAKIHEKISNKRKDFSHKVSSKLINENQVICLESLSVKNMIKNHKLAKSISDTSWGTFANMLTYKANLYGRTISKIDRFFPSSKLCNNCGYINESLKLSNREWTCESCNKVHDRDINAAKNILRQGLNLVAGLGTKSVKKPVEALTGLNSIKVKSMRQEGQLSLAVD